MRDLTMRALGGNVDDERAPFLEGIVQSRALLLELAVLAEGAEHPDAPIFRVVRSECLVRIARYFRLLGLTRHDVRRLDLGRRRRAMH